MVVGMYALALRITQIPSKFLSEAISNVLFQKISYLKNNKKKFINLIYKFLIYQLFVGLLIALLLFYISDYMGILLGKKWKEIGDYLIALILWITVAYIVRPLAFSVLMANKQKTALYLEIVYGLVKFFSLMAGIYSGDIILTLFIFSISNSVFILIQGFWYLSLLKSVDKK